MKKGSRAVKCQYCGEIIAWKIPVGTLFGIIPEVKMKFVKPSKIEHHGWACRECISKRTSTPA